MSVISTEVVDALLGLTLPGGREQGIQLLSRATTSDKVSVLYEAASRENDALVDLLLENGVDVNIVDEAFTPPVTALAKASWFNEAHAVELLINRKAHIHTPGRGYGMTAFQAAVKDNFAETIEVMMNARVNVNEPLISNRGRTAIQQAAGSGNTDLVKCLLEKGADVNAPAAENGGRTALQAAAESGSTEVVEILIEKGAEINALAAETKGKTALRAAVDGKQDGSDEDCDSDSNEDEDQRVGADDAEQKIKPGLGGQ